MKRNVMERSTCCWLTMALVTVAFSHPAGAAEDDGKPAEKKWTTDLVSEGFESMRRKDAKDAKEPREIRVEGGGISQTGNTRLLAATGGAVARFREGDDQLALAFAANYVRTAAPGEPLRTSVENLQGRLRGDHFFREVWTLFLGTQARRDRLAGLDLRLQIDPGIGYFLHRTEKERAFVELGYDFLFDVRTDDARVVTDKAGAPVLDAAGNPTLLDKTRVVHGLRAFIGYDYQFSDDVGISGGLEYLPGINDLTLWRMNGELGATSKLGKHFSLATTFTFRYDHVPLPGKEHLDTLTTVKLVWRIL